MSTYNISDITFSNLFAHFEFTITNIFL